MTTPISALHLGQLRIKRFTTISAYRLVRTASICGENEKQKFAVIRFYLVWSWTLSVKLLMPGPDRREKRVIATGARLRSATGKGTQARVISNDSAYRLSKSATLS
jgi:hypothetical protein